MLDRKVLEALHRLESLTVALRELETEMGKVKAAFEGLSKAFDDLNSLLKQSGGAG